ncbi:MAG TPA: nicotinamide-nucleotide amidohydrolase family protein [Actinomycetales bacterium]|nr:nicotinamide-nucleotide amidohydrolase family protein [Actinomycetales bacterium]
MTTAEDVVALATSSRTTIAVAESVTAGLVCARIADVPGASVVLRGGVIAYATELKTVLLDVDPALLASCGPVAPEVARAMATGVRKRLGADVGVATTGVAGPDSSDGVVAGTVYVAVVGSGDERLERLSLAGDRAAVRAGATEAALALLCDLVRAARNTG